MEPEDNWRFGVSFFTCLTTNIDVYANVNIC